MLTAKQRALLLYINDRIQADGVSPSFDEMKDALGLKSKSGIHRLVGALEERGFLRKLANRARALEVLRLPNDENGMETAVRQDQVPQGAMAQATATVLRPDFGTSQAQSAAQPPHDMVSIPLHGRIAAGTPIEAIERADSHIDVPPAMLGHGNCYALEISGDSMVEKGIMDGDTIIVEQCQSARDGEIVVALVDREEATLKTWKPQGNMVALMPANASHEPQILEANRVAVQGRLVGLYRRYH